RIEPLRLVLAGFGQEGGVDFPIVAADELADLFLALDHHGERRRLYPSDSREEEAAVARIEGGHRACAVDANQPVGFRTRPSRVGQPGHLLVAAQLLEAVADRLRRHRLQPQALHGLAQWLDTPRELLDQPED